MNTDLHQILTVTTDKNESSSSKVLIALRHFSVLTVQSFDEMNDVQMSTWGLGDRAYWVVESVFQLSSCWIVRRVTITEGNSIHLAWETMFKASTDNSSVCTDSDTALAVPALMRELHWYRCWAEETGYAADNLPEDYGLETAASLG